MPLIKVHAQEGAYSSSEAAAALEAIHNPMVESFNVPQRDRYQIFMQHREGFLVAEDTGLGFERSPRFLLIEIFSRQRTREQKETFYRKICGSLHEAVGLLPTDLMMTFQINGDEDWSFGSGTAQFLTGELS